MFEFKTKLEPFGRGFVNCESENKAVKISAGLINCAKELPLNIDLNNGMPEFNISSQAFSFSFGNSVTCNSGLLNEIIDKTPEEKDELLLIKEKMWPYLKHETELWDCFTKRQSEHEKAMDIWAGYWMGHCVPKYADIAIHGTDGYRAKVEKYRKINPGKDDFYDSINLLMDAIDIFGERFYHLADEMLKTETEEKHIEILETIKHTFSHAPKKPCKDFAEAVIVFFMMFQIDGCDSPGHFDQYMYDFWKVTDQTQAKKYLRYLWDAFFKLGNIMNLCISGSDENWNDISNDLTYAILEVTAETAYNTPNLTMRCHRNTPDKLLQAAHKSIGTGCGLPVLYNDEAVCPALESLGIPSADAHRYVMNGCNQIDIQGKSHMGLEDGEVCLAKSIEYTLFNGYSPYMKKELALKTGDPTEFKTYDEFYAAVIKQIDYLIDTATSKSNSAQKLFAKEAPNPFRSAFIEGCIEKGLDYKQGGPLYGHGQILAEAIAETVDSLAVIKKYVYEEKRFTMAELVDALSKDFEGYEDLYHFLKNNDLKFGNDIDYVDEIAKGVVDHYNSYLKTIPTYRGGYFTGGCSPFNRSARYAKTIGALPNGKKKDDYVIGDSIGCTPGKDVNGPTALMNSCLKFDHTLPASGFILNLKFDKEMFNTDAGKDGFAAICRSYFGQKGQQLTITVVSLEDLLDAKVNPQNHQNLIVRIGGYSARFIDLTPELQDNVIARTSHTTM
ncbi:MAG: hypothetical protein E7560_06300 [Ruminococcaceae bacterium]|nr:hypothetical protein [Oscillospiraceae bacterium]